MKVAILILLGLSRISANKIIGGEDAYEGQFPSMAGQTKAGSFFCGATIVSENSVLTAAHCQQTNFAGYRIVAGTTNKLSGGIVKDVIQMIIKPDYEAATTSNDVMILRVATPFRFDDERFPLGVATIPTVSPPPATQITVVGWGDTNIGIGQSFPNILKFVEVVVISTEQCNQEASYNGTVYDGMICMGVMEGGLDSCQGDSGGPAYLQGTNTVAGITSWGYGCAVEGYPGVYADVAYFQDWIHYYIDNE